MNQQKRAARQQKPKPANYLTRDAIEQTVQRLGTDRARFCEVSKLLYRDVQKQFYYAFCNYPYHTEPRYTETEFRSDLQETFIAGELQQPDWNTFIQEIRKALPANEKLYLLANSKWVYVGYAAEICTVITEAASELHWSEFVVFPPSCAFCIAYNYIENTAVLYRKKCE